MQHDGSAAGAGAPRSEMSGVAIQDIVGVKEQTLIERLISSQAFWVTVALVVIIVVMMVLQPDAFASRANFYNITRNFAFIGLMAVGMTAVIITGGIDLSVGSIMGLVGVVCGVLLEGGHAWWVAMLGGLVVGMATGAVNGLLIAYVGLSPFVVTLGMLSFARSVAIVLSGNRMIYEFGPDGATFKALREGGIVGLVVDWGYRAEDVPVKLFGEWATLPAGPVMLAARTNAPIVPVVCRRMPDGFYEARHYEPIEVANASPAETLRVTRLIATVVEDMIATAPDQWYSFKPIWPDTDVERQALADRAAEMESSA